MIEIKLFLVRRINHLLFFIFLLIVSTVCSQDTCKIPIYIKDREIWVEVAKTPEQRVKGLMWRKNLGKDDGMLFIFEEEEYHSFWMKNTYIPLSIAFIDKDGIIVDIKEMEPLSTASISPPKPVLFALEMPKGWFYKNGIKKGDTIRFSR